MNRKFRRKMSRTVSKKLGANSNYLNNNHISIINELISTIKPIYIPDLDDLSVKLMNTLEDLFYNSSSISYIDTWTDENNPTEVSLAVDESTILNYFIKYLEDVGNLNTILVYDNLFKAYQFLDKHEASPKSALAEMLFRDYSNYTTSLDKSNGAYVVEGKFSTLFISLHQTIIRCATNYIGTLIKQILTYISVQYKDLNNLTDDKIIDNEDVDKVFNGIILTSNLTVAKKISSAVSEAKQRDFASEFEFISSIAKVTILDKCCDMMVDSVGSCLDYFIKSVIKLNDFNIHDTSNTNFTSEFNTDSDTESDIFKDYQLLSQETVLNNGADSEDIKGSVRNLKYIDKYRDLNKLATDSGFNYVRSNGDHGIYQNNKGNTVIIPQGRTIGKGLSLAIQSRLLHQ